MAWVTNTWLKGNAERDRDHTKTEGAIHIKINPNAKNSKVLTISVTRDGGDYQRMYFSQPEVEKILEAVTNLAVIPHSAKAIRSKRGEAAWFPLTPPLPIRLGQPIFTHVVASI